MKCGSCDQILHRGFVGDYVNAGYCDKQCFEESVEYRETIKRINDFRRQNNRD